MAPITDNFLSKFKNSLQSGIKPVSQPVSPSLISGPAQPRVNLIQQALSAGSVASQAPSGVSVGAASSAGLQYNPGSPILGPKPLVSMTPDPNASGTTTLASSMVNPGGSNKVTSTSTPLEAIRQGITAKESGGNYKAQSKTSTASGRYQYLDGTWGNYKGYKKASDAPPEVQDEKFNQDMGKFLTKYNGNLEAAAIAWFQGPGVADKFVKGDTSVLLKKDANGKTTASYSQEVANIARSYLNAGGPPPPVGATTSRVARDKQGRNILAVGTADEFSKLGYKVDGFSVSAQHHLTNPNSKHETGDAIDIHTKGEDLTVVNKLIAEGKANNIIHNGVIYSKKNGYKPRPYTGKFSNGQPKDPHANHVHADY